jgi:hypothetical protein
MGIIFFGLLPLPGLLSVTAFLFGLVIVLVIHSSRGQPWRAVLVRAGVGLVTLWLAVSAVSLTLLDQLTGGGASGGVPASGADSLELVLKVVVTAVLLLVLAGGLLAWIANASRPRAAAATSRATPQTRA